MRTAIRATVTHDTDTWFARIAHPLTGRNRNGRPISSHAVVLGIEPDARTIYTRGGSDWAPVAQVHKISDVEWAELETEDVDLASRSAVVAARVADGWALHQTLELVDEPDRVRLMFTRPAV